MKVIIIDNITYELIEVEKPPYCITCIAYQNEELCKKLPLDCVLDEDINTVWKIKTP